MRAKRAIYTGDRAGYALTGISPYGWLVLGACTLIIFGVCGAELSFGVFLKPIMEEFGQTRGMVSGAISIAEGIGGLVGMFMGRLADKHGARMPVTMGTLVGGLGFLLMSLASSFWQVYLCFGVMVGLCIAAVWVPIIATISRWFVEKRLLALGIITGGMTIGHMLLPPAVAYSIAGYGWRFTSVMLALIVFIFAIPAVMLLGKTPSKSTGVIYHERSDKGNVADKVGERIQTREWVVTEAARTVPFWMLGVVSFTSSIGFFLVAVHIVPYATDTGIATTSAALILTFMNGANILGKLLVAPVTARIGGRSTLFILLALQALALFSLTRVTSLWMLFALGAVFGIAFGATSPIRLSMIPEFFGTSSVGSITGSLGVAWAIGGIIGPVLAGYTFDLSHSYDIAFLIGGLLVIAGMAAVYFLQPPTRRRKEEKWAATA